MNIEFISSLISEPQMLHNSRRIIGASLVSLLDKNSTQQVPKSYEDFRNELKSEVFDTGVTSENKRVVIIPVVGTVRANGYGSTAQIHNLLDELEQDPQIAGVVFYHNTPGGSASGTGILAHRIKSFSKPTATYVHGLCCSAGAYLAGPTDRRFVNHRADWMGSIGTMLSGLDMIPLFEKFGAKYFEVYADGSEDKNKSWRDLVKGEEQTIKEEINSYRNEFVEDMKSFQPNLPEEVFSGKVYRPKEAVEKGLADQIGTLQDACSWVYSQSLNTNINSEHMSNKNFANIAEVIGADEVVATSVIPGIGAKTRSLTSDQLEAIDNRLEGVAQLEANVTSLTEQITALQNALTTATSNLQRLESAVITAMENANVDQVQATEGLTNLEANFNALVNELGGRSAANPVNVHSPEEQNTNNAPTMNFFEGIDLKNL